MKPKNSRAIYLGAHFYWAFRDDWQALNSVAKKHRLRFNKDIKRYMVPDGSVLLSILRMLVDEGEPATNINVYDFETEELIPIERWQRLLAEAKETSRRAKEIIEETISPRKKAKAKPLALSFEPSAVRLQIPLLPSSKPRAEHAVLFGLAKYGCEAAHHDSGEFIITKHHQEASEWLLAARAEWPEMLVSGLPRMPEQVSICSTFDGLFAHQRVGINFLYHRRKAILADDMGCIDGDAIVTYNRAGRSAKCTLREFVHKFNGGESQNNGHVRRWDPSIPTKIRCLYQGELRSMLVTGAYNRGFKATRLIELEDGKTLRCTADHEVMTERGWVPAEKLIVGEKVLTNGQKIGTDGYVYVNGVFKHPHCPKRPNQYMLEHRLVMEASLNGMGTAEWIKHFQAGDAGVFLEKNIHVHHKNGNRADNRLENLEILTAQEHQIEHNCKARITNFIPKKSAIKSITNGGIREVFDVTVPGADSFVANGIVVHNCGKTLQSILAAEQLCLEKRADYLLVICPISLVPNWRRELVKWESSFGASHARIVPYSQLAKLKSIPPKTIVIIDEAHAIKRVESQRTQAIIRFAEDQKAHIAALWLLTGTPVTRDNGDIWPLAHLIDHPVARLFPPLKLRAMRSDVENAMLAGAMKTHLLMRKKEDVLDLPPKIRQVVDVDTGVQGGSLEDIRMLLKKSPESLQEHLMRLKRLTAEAKAPATIAHVEELLAAGRKVIVFSDHRESLHSIYGHFQKIGACPVIIDGSVSDRDTPVQRFQNDAKCRVFLGNIKAAGVGLTLTAASDVVFNDADWLPANMLQAEDRAHRIGTKGTVNVYMMADPNMLIDTVMLRILANRSQEIASFEQSEQTFMAEVARWAKENDE